MRQISVQEVKIQYMHFFERMLCDRRRCLALLLKILETETSPFGREVLQRLIENDLLAAERQMPICQDTGMAVVFMDVGQDVHFIGGDVNLAIRN